MLFTIVSPVFQRIVKGRKPLCRITTDHMIKLALAGGKMSLSIMQNSQPTLKPDHSVLTRADTAISKMIRKSLQAF